MPVTFTVNTTNDEALVNPADVNCVSNLAPLHCSLRGALAAADNRGNDVTTINLPAGTYTLTRGALTFGNTAGENVSIVGAGGPIVAQSAGCTEPANDCMVFFIDPIGGGGITVAMSGLTIQGGHTTNVGGGGGILAGSLTALADSLTLSNCTITGNTSTGGPAGGGGVAFVHGTLTINACNFNSNQALGGGNGGAIDFADTVIEANTLSISGSTFSTNSSTATLNGGGGAIHLLGPGSTYTISGSTFTNNSATSATAPGGGGGILKDSGALSIRTSTFTGNTAGTTGAGGAVNSSSDASDLGTVGSPGLSRFAGNIAKAGSGQSFFRDSGNTGVVTADQNWWGSNTPNTSDAVVTSPLLNDWFELKLTASPAFVPRLGSTALTGDLSHTHNNLTPGTLPNVTSIADTWPAVSLGTLSAQTFFLNASSHTTATFTAGNTSGAGSASVQVDGQTVVLPIPILFPATVAKVFGAGSIPLNTNTSLTFNLTNPNSVSPLTGIDFSDTLPAGLVVAAPNGLTGSCGAGTISATQGGNLISLTGGSILASGTCSFAVNVTGTTAGTKTNITTAPTSNEAGTGVPATNAVINVVAPPSIAKVFNPTSVALNGTTSLQFTITNPAPNAVALNGVQFTDTLPAGLTVANASATVCGGTLTTAAPTGITLSGATIAVNSQCIFSVTVTGAATGIYTNTTGSVTSTNGGTGNTASANLTVASPPTITKSFGAATIPLNGSTSLSFTISNPNTNVALTGVGFADNLPAGLVVATPNGLSGSCGSGTIGAAAGSGSVGLNGGTLAGSGSCTFSANVTGTTAGVKNNSTQVSSNEGGTGNTTNASITVIAPPTISKVFGAASITMNSSTSLTFTLSNPNTTSSLTGVGFGDALPAGLVISSPNGLTGTCGGGTITATAGSNVIMLSGATLAASANCTFAVNVKGVAAGDQVNATGPVTSVEGGSGSAATATVNVVAPPVISKAFGAPGIALNGTTSLSFTITNPAGNTVPLTGINFVDFLPFGLLVATPNGQTGVCGGGFISAPPNGNSIQLVGATLAPSSSCTFAVNIVGKIPGPKVNTTTPVLSANGGLGNTATASIEVAIPPQIAKSFGSAEVPLNGSTSLSFTITSFNTVVSLTGVGFTDTLPAGLVVASPNGLSGSCGGGTIAAAAGSGTVSLSGGTLAPSTSCTFSINVTGTSVGVKNNSVTVNSTEGGPGGTSNASVTVVAPPTISKGFGGASIPLGGSTSLSFTISNPNPTTTLTGVGFGDTLPAGLVVATPNGLTGSCGGGTITAAAGTNDISLAGASLAASASCTFSVNVTGTAGGDQVNTSGNVSSLNGGTGGTATATVNVVVPPTIAKAFGAAHVVINGTTSLTFTINNPAVNTVSLTGVGFTDTLPAGLVISTPNGLVGSCGGGVIVAVAGTGTISLSGATLATDSSCSFSVNITGTASANYTNTSGPVSSTNGGTGNSATANLQVADPPTITVTFNPTSIALNGTTTFTITITNPVLNTVALTGVGFNDPPAGLQVAQPNNLSNTCGGTASAVPGSSTLTLSGGTVAVASSCSFSVTLVGVAVGTWTDTVTVFSDQGLSGAVSASVDVLAATPESGAPARSQPIGLLLGLLVALLTLFGGIAMVARRRRERSIR